jgi:hypothetical protein
MLSKQRFNMLMYKLAITWMFLWTNTLKARLHSCKAMELCGEESLIQ